MGQYYYRPIDPGYADLGAGLAAGITGGMQAFLGEREATRQRKREEEEDKRRTQLTEMQIADYLAQGEGGFGPVPTEERVSETMKWPEGVWRPPAATTPPGKMAPGQIGDMLMPRGLPTVTETREQVPVEGYMPIGDWGYRRTPKAMEQERYQLGVGRERQAYELGQERQEAERERRQLELGPAGMAMLGSRELPPGVTQEHVGTLMEAGVNVPSWLPPGGIVEGSPEDLAYREQIAQINARYRERREPPEEPIVTMAQEAMELVNDLGREYRMGWIDAPRHNEQLRTILRRYGFENVDQVTEALRTRRGQSSAGTTGPSAGKQTITQDQYDWLTASVAEGGRGMSHAEVDRLYVVR